VAAALGRTLGLLYVEGLLEAQRETDAELRTVRRAELDAELAEPAREMLALARLERQSALNVASSTDDPVELARDRYAAALLDFVAGEPERALELAEQAALAPQVYEALVLAGQIHRRRAGDERWAGRFDDATASLERARSAYERAAQIGRSDADLYLEVCSAWNEQMELDRDGGRPFDAAAAAGIASCDRSLVADPEQAVAPLHQARIYWRLGEERILRGEDPRRELDEVVRVARRAWEADAGERRAFILAGLGWANIGKHLDDVGEDPMPAFASALEILEEGLERHPDYRTALNNVGFVHAKIASHLERRGEDPEQQLRRSAEAYRRCIEVDPTYVYAYSNLSDVLRRLADEREDPDDTGEELLAEAIELAEQALERNPRYANALNHHASALQALAELRFERHGSLPDDLLRRAEESLHRAIELRPGVWSYYGNLGFNRFIRAEAELAGGADPQATLDAARAAYEQALEINPRAPFLAHMIGRLEVLEARAAIARRLNPLPAFERARAQFDRTLELQPTNVAALRERAEASLLESELGGRGAAGARARAEADLARIAEQEGRSEESAAAGRAAESLFRGGTLPPEEHR
jgi:tetratricopeptide (TPR) repeat protein